MEIERNGRDATVLPIPAVWWVALPWTSGPAEVAVPPGLPVVSVSAGRVIRCDSTVVGGVVVAAGSTRFHYGRLQGSSVKVTKGERVRAGQVLGSVAPPADDTHPMVEVGVQRDDGVWLDPFAFFMGLPEPELRGMGDLTRKKTPQVPRASEPSSSTEPVRSLPQSSERQTHAVVLAEPSQRVKRPPVFDLSPPVEAPADPASDVPRHGVDSEAILESDKRAGDTAADDATADEHMRNSLEQPEDEAKPPPPDDPPDDDLLALIGRRR